MAGKRNGPRRHGWRLLTVLAVLAWAQAVWGAGEVTIKTATLIPSRGPSGTGSFRERAPSGKRKRCPTDGWYSVSTPGGVGR